MSWAAIREELGRLEVVAPGPYAVKDEDATDPRISPRALDAARSWAQKAEVASLDPPLRVIPDGEWGLVFEWLAGSRHRIVRIDATGSINHAHYISGGGNGG